MMDSTTVTRRAKDAQLSSCLHFHVKKGAETVSPKSEDARNGGRD